MEGSDEVRPRGRESNLFHTINGNMRLGARHVGQRHRWNPPPMRIEGSVCYRQTATTPLVMLMCISILPACSCMSTVSVHHARICSPLCLCVFPPVSAVHADALMWAWLLLMCYVLTDRLSDFRAHHPEHHRLIPELGNGGHLGSGSTRMSMPQRFVNLSTRASTQRPSEPAPIDSVACRGDIAVVPQRSGAPLH